jgi:predicted DNA-binding antitoxin AbrB/MazE fold protein
MAEIVTAVYENGMLRPLQPLNLREHQTVRLQIMLEEPAPQEEPDKVEEVIQSLVASGLTRPRPKRGTPPPDPVSEEERRRLADIMGKAPGKPLSEIIIEERGEW